MKNTLLILILLFLSQHAHSQFGYGIVVQNGLYDQYTNPTEDAHPSAGNALLNLGIGPKIWVGKDNFSLSVEALAHIGLTGFSIGEYKGLGMLAIPMLAKLNFNGVSSVSKKGKPGFYVGGGLQYNRTELYGLSSESKQAGINRDYFTTYVGEVGVGFGVNGFVTTLFYRYGAHPDNGARTNNIGVALDFNIVSLKDIEKEASKLY